MITVQENVDVMSDIGAMTVLTRLALLTTSRINEFGYKLQFIYIYRSLINSVSVQMVFATELLECVTVVPTFYLPTVLSLSVSNF